MSYFTIRSFESKELYELLRVKPFKALCIRLGEFALSLSPDKNCPRRGGYFLKEYSVTGLRKYTTTSKYYEGLHLFMVAWCGVNLLIFGLNIISLLTMLLNIYCILLQRYNRLRIESILKKYNK